MEDKRKEIGEGCSDDPEFIIAVADTAEVYDEDEGGVE